MTGRERIPTVRELAEADEKLAVAIAWNKDGEPTMWRLLPDGWALLGVLMRRNAILYGVENTFEVTREERRAQGEAARRKANP